VVLTDDEALVRRVFHEGSSVRNSRAELDELFASDFRCHGPPEMEHGHDGGSEGIETCIFNNAFAGLSFTVHAISTDADRVVARFSARGRQIAEFQGVPPADQDVTLSGIATFRVERRQIAEGWGSLSWE
jgi:hypothetical protein